MNAAIIITPTPYPRAIATITNVKTSTPLPYILPLPSSMYSPIVRGRS